jgi:hypothetical protein
MLQIWRANLKFRSKCALNCWEYVEWTDPIEHGSVWEGDSGSVGNKFHSFYRIWTFSSFSQTPSLIHCYIQDQTNLVHGHNWFFKSAVFAISLPLPPFASRSSKWYLLFKFCTCKFAFISHLSVRRVCIFKLFVFFPEHYLMNGIKLISNNITVCVCVLEKRWVLEIERVHITILALSYFSLF